MTREERKEQARLIRRYAERIARLAKKFEDECAPGYQEDARLSEICSTACVIVMRAEFALK